MAQYKTSEDLEIYEVDYTTNKQLQEVCDVKQPFLVNFQNISETHDFFDLIQCTKMDGQFDDIDSNIKCMHDYQEIDKSSVEYITLPYRNTRLTLKNDPHGKYLSCENRDFIEETNADALFGTMNNLIKPAMSYSTKYDILFGSKFVCTPLKYHNSNRLFLAVCSGRIRVKMTPWKSRKYIDWIKDYDKYEFVAKANVWKDEKQGKHKKSGLDKLKFIEFDVVAGYVLYVPPYWWYSLQFSADSDTTVCQFTYDTIINGIAHTKDLVLYLLQQSNITRKTQYKQKINNALHDDHDDSAGNKISVYDEEYENKENVNGGAKNDGERDYSHSINSRNGINVSNVAKSGNNQKIEDGSNYSSSMPEKVDYIEPKHNEIVSNAGIYHVPMLQ
jgi:hypothetical protein